MKTVRWLSGLDLGSRHCSQRGQPWHSLADVMGIIGKVDVDLLQLAAENQQIDLCTEPFPQMLLGGCAVKCDKLGQIG